MYPLAHLQLNDPLTDPRDGPPEDHSVLSPQGEVPDAFPQVPGAWTSSPRQGQFSARDCDPRGEHEKNKPRKAKPAFLLLLLRPSLGPGPHVLRDGGGRPDRAFGSGWNFLFFAIPAGVGGSPAPQTTHGLCSSVSLPSSARRDFRA